MPLRSADPAQSFPAGPAQRDFLGRFGDAYVAELAAFIDVAAGQAASPWQDLPGRSFSKCANKRVFH
jgi:myo-inositol 2-dehydrogenase/D-chiro-inositol 1-dehydrogenase